MRLVDGGRDVLHDHVEVDLGLGERLEDARRLADLVGHRDHRDLGLAPVVRDAGDDRLLHSIHLCFGNDPRALLLAEGGADVDGHVVAAGVLDAPQVQDLRAARRHLEHLLGGDPVELASGRDDARVGGEHAVDVAVDLAHLGVEGGSQRHGGGVRGPAAERGDVLGVLRDTLEAGDDRDVALVDGLLDPAGRDVDDLRLAVRAVGDDAGLAAGEGPRALAEVGDRHRHQRHRDPLAGGQQHVQLARRRERAHLLGEVAQLVGGVAHGGDHHDDVLAGLLGGDDALGDSLDAVSVGDRRAAVLLHDNAHTTGDSTRSRPGRADPVVRGWRGRAARRPPRPGPPRSRTPRRGGRGPPPTAARGARRWPRCPRWRRRRTATTRAPR